MKGVDKREKKKRRWTQVVREDKCVLHIKVVTNLEMTFYSYGYAMHSNNINRHKAGLHTYFL